MLSILLNLLSRGNVADFGNLSVTRYQLGGLSNQTRAVNCGGYESENIYKCYGLCHYCFKCR